MKPIETERTQVFKRMKEHIFAVMNHYKAKTAYFAVRDLWKEK